MTRKSQRSFLVALVANLLAISGCSVYHGTKIPIFTPGFTNAFNEIEQRCGSLKGRSFTRAKEAQGSVVQVKVIILGYEKEKITQDCTKIFHTYGDNLAAAMRQELQRRTEFYDLSARCWVGEDRIAIYSACEFFPTGTYPVNKGDFVPAEDEEL